MCLQAAVEAEQDLAVPEQDLLPLLPMQPGAGPKWQVPVAGGIAGQVEQELQSSPAMGTAIKPYHSQSEQLSKLQLDVQPRLQ